MLGEAFDVRDATSSMGIAVEHGGGGCSRQQVSPILLRILLLVFPDLQNSNVKS